MRRRCAVRISAWLRISDFRTRMKKDLSKTKTAFKYKPRFAAIVECASEAEQKKLHARLQKLGHTVRLVRV